ncbi:hypothetical protein [Pseudobacteriovorax antillogorgiicola]|uniref:Uncharacterized protein n=1 Tax=Pseudobacteriovorax antillogorgiicola TaxID=1513793 RepID=A0A1Y6CR59_9BACT|nr:hypothetical protein [Pseudobacteriovorax antillogorgiicola]TCS45646.1 hypothetical protein EDD56_12739 [Pseudobacteriovorax antillogorgiicola]SMF72837.1 hypothetical protein SAMN06296036_12738 [Pseudobacteriovorax antillogorgiicola]
MKFVLLSLLLIAYQMSFASSKKVEDVDSILDRLERKLMESKQESFLLNDNWNKPLRPPAKTNYSYKKTTIKPVLPSGEKLQEVSMAIDKIDREVKRLGADMERLKQILGQQIEHESLIEIATELQAPKESILRALTIHLDDYQIYQLNPDVGLWAPRTTVPIYFGPLKPGKHKVRIEGRVARVISENMPIDDNMFNTIEQEFTIDVPSGVFKKGFKIAIEKPGDKRFKTKAKIIEYNL